MGAALVGVGLYCPDEKAQYYMALWTGRSWLLQLVVSWTILAPPIFSIFFIIVAWLGFGSMFLWSEFLLEL